MIISLNTQRNGAASSQTWSRLLAGDERRRAFRNRLQAGSYMRWNWRVIAGLFLLLGISLRAAAAAPATVEQWDVFELTLPGPSTGNPFTEVELSAQFTQGVHAVKVRGFYDGKGTYKLRFMPETNGDWRYQTASNRAELADQTGLVTVTPARDGNHGPVRVHNTFHFAYADGTPYRPIGTTCYVWTHQGDELEEQTLQTLANSPFNKIRFCIFPKNFDWNHNEPIYYPFQGTPPKTWDFTRFNPEYFQHFERRLAQLRSLGIEADIILFHPYDKGHWGFDHMDPASDERYLRYVVARLSAYRNVWWSLANEFDLLEKKTSDWDRFFQIIQAEDPVQHLRSIHQDKVYYNQNQPWVTHASIQNSAAVLEYGRAMIYRDVYRKPIVFDEVKYEGNIPARWGNITAEDMVRRFWIGTVVGTYVGHGETFLDPKDVLWWSKGGVLHGQSPARLAFLKKILEDAPEISPVDKWQEIAIGGKVGQYYLAYFGDEPRPAWKFELFHTGITDGMKFTVEVIDTWNMTITPVPGEFEMKTRDAYFFEDKEGKSVTLPGRPYIALRIRVKK